MKQLLFVILFFIVFNSTHAADYIVEFNRPLSEVDISLLKKQYPTITIEKFYNAPDDYFQRLYSIVTDITLNDQLALSIEDLSIIRVEGSHQFEAFALKPSQSLENDFGDPLFSYQWHLVNQGQWIYQDIDDIRSRVITGKKGMDIGLSASLIDMESRLKNDVIVAVIDSGIDYNHPDLKSLIAKNIVECDDKGEIILAGGEDVVADNDNNELHGDCMGWDFTRHKSDPRARVPRDDIGHGTHVAGLIAALNNSEGINSVSGNGKIKILPVKVLAGSDSSNPNPVGMTDRLARGILYATRMGAKVINLSLGWPKSIDTEYLRKSVTFALSHGVTIVAAAGNNNTSSPIFPCAYHHVICVGATQIDGDFALFSNHGGHVDMLAPGDQILSTYPRSFSPLHFPLIGYEVKNGTSQAAPLVAMAAAFLKSSFDNISESEIKARLLLTANSTGLKTDKISLTGQLQLSDALNATARPAIFPVLKELDQIVFSAANNNRFQFDLRIKNFWADSQAVKVDIQTSANIEIDRKQYSFESLKADQSALFRIVGRVLDSDNDNTATIEIVVTENDKAQTFKHTLPLVRLMANDPEIKHLPIKLENENHRLAEIRNGLILPNLGTVDDPYRLASSALYTLAKTTKGTPNDGIELFFFNIGESEVQENKKTLFLKEAEKIIAITIGDYNYDQKPDLLIRSIHQGEETPYIQYSFYSMDLAPLYGDKSFWRFIPEVVVENLSNSTLIPYELEGIGNVAIPVFSEFGALPRVDNPSSPWSSPDRSVLNRLYYLQPVLEDGKIHLQTRAITTKKFQDELRKKYNLQWNDTIAVIGPLTQTKNSFRQGKASFHLSVGKAYLRKDYALELSKVTAYETKELPFHSMRVEADIRFPLTYLSEDGFMPNAGDVFVGFKDNATAKISFSQQEWSKPLHTSYYFTRSSSSDHILGHIASYRDQSGQTSVFQTKSNLLVIRNEQDKTYEGLYPIARFSFLPGQVLNDLFFPLVTLDKNEKPVPSIFVDNTQINSNRLHIIQAVDEGKLVKAPAKFSFLVPDNCKSMNPVTIGNNSHATLVFLCKYNGANWAMKFFDLK